MISIIIPTLNEEKILGQTLTALRKLHVVDYEIIVSDGNSSDATLKIARQLADKVFVHQKPHRQTIAEGKNLGAAQASGNYLVFLDADVFIPHINVFFTNALALFENDPQLQGLTVFLKVLPEHVTLSDRLFFGIVNRLYQFSNNVLHKGAASGEFQMIRTQAFHAVGGYDQKFALGEDNEMFASLSKLGKTRIATELHVLHTSRRAHSIGWTRLLSLWVGNFAYAKFFKKSMQDEWKVIR